MKNNRHNINKKREIVHRLVAEGKTTKEIGLITGYTSATIRYYREPSKEKESRTINQKVASQRRKMKRKLVNYSGGKCIKCGYDKNDAALTFHHINPKEKEFGVGNGNIKSYDRNKNECDKCCLLCHNCHSEFHAGSWELTNQMVEGQRQVRKDYKDKPLINYDDPGCLFDESIL